MTHHECTSEIKQFLNELPKCEHHLHLEGTLEPALLFNLAKRNNIVLPKMFPPTVEACNERYANFADLQDFLDHYYIGMSVLIQEEDFYDLAMAYFTRAHQDGCLHSEVFFDLRATLREESVSMLWFKALTGHVKRPPKNSAPRIN